MGVLQHQTIIWKKNNFVIGRCDYQWIHEPCFYGWQKGNRPEFYGEKNQTTVWDIARDTVSPLHPTQKPVAMMMPPIENHLKSGEVVYDPFLGSGTTLIAAHRLNRRCFGVEIEPRYCEVILRRAEAEGLSVACETCA
jgi:site-specific DNA-methyltransferase (adenine-specific)